MNKFHIFTLIIINTSSLIGHNSHSNKASYKACEQKQQNNKCFYTNSHKDLFKGSCQIFSQKLVCVRNKPIVRERKLNLST